MRIFNREKRQANGQTSIISVLLFGLVITFFIGLWAGYQLWGKPELDSEQQAANPRHEIPIDEYDAVRGPADAKVVMVEFTDYECSFCRRYYTETYHQIIETYGDQIRYVVKDLPLVSIHPNAIPSAVAAHCAGEQDSFWEYHDQLFIQALGLSGQALQSYAQNVDLDLQSFNDCLDSNRYDQVVLADINLLERINAPLSTPTFFINGQYIAGAQPFSVFAKVIEAELASVE